MPKIDDYDFVRIVVDGLEQIRDVILLPGRVVLTGGDKTTAKWFASKCCPNRHHP